ncbi:hypothetical protein [Bacillus cereus]|uniref:hypothetical protein n=1 Tax=Bacillus cereus TaxID=1396 RepID=UPI00397DEABA
MKRIESVEKIIERSFDEKGINKFMAKVNINSVGNIDFLPMGQLINKTLGAIKRKYYSLLKECKTIDDVQKILNTIPMKKIERYIEIEEISEQTFVECDKEYMSKLLYLVLKIKEGKGTRSDYYPKIKELLPLIIRKTIIKEGKEESSEFLTVAKINVPPTVEYNTKLGCRKNHYLIGRSKDRFSIRSLAAEMASMFLLGVVNEYTIKNPQLYELKMINKYVENYYSKDTKILLVPKNETDASLVINQINRYYKELIVEDYQKNEDEQLNNIVGKLKLEIVNGRVININTNEILRLMIKEFILESEQIHIKSKRYHDSLTAYAKSFQEKKHITKEHQYVMKNNVFLKRFSSVELDNIVDLKEVRKLEDEFIKLSSEVYIPNSVEKNISFKIKRIRHHKASGLFYPKPIGCLIIDRSGISSFLHELGHLIDFEEEKYQLSESIEFKAVYDLYRRNLVNKVGNIKDYKKVKIGEKSLSYYLEKAEVFARSFEVYYGILKGVNNSLLKSQNDYANRQEYPIEDEEYMNMVRSYFEKVLKNKPINSIKEEENLRTVKNKRLLPSSDIIITNESFHGKMVQLSLFDEIAL